MPRVSVILISKNVKPYIEKCLASVTEQSLRDIEIICVDAFSTDGTREIVRAYMDKDSRISLLDDDKGSAGYSYNLGIKKAVGEYLAFVETDDYIREDMLENLYEIAKKKNLDYVKADYDAYWTQDDGTQVIRRRNTFDSRDIYDCVICPRCHIEIATGDWYMWKGIYKRSFLLEKEISFSETPGAAFQDIGFLHLTSTLASRAVYTRNSYYVYCTDRDGSSSNGNKRLRFTYQEYKRLVEQYTEANDMEAHSLLYARMAKSFVSCYSGMDESNKNTDDLKNEEYDCFLRDKLANAIADGILKKEYVPSGIWEKLCIILDFKSGYRSWMRRKEERLKNFLDKAKDHAIIIFGCGTYGSGIYHILLDKGYAITAFMDNDRNLWGGSINGCPIYSPDDVRKKGEEWFFCIANETWYRQIEEKLCTLGVDEERIFIYE